MKRDFTTLPKMLLASVLLLQSASIQAQLDLKTVPGDRETVRPFKVQIPSAQLKQLRKKIEQTRWPESETVTDASQGPMLANIKKLVRYWGRSYNWRKGEKKLNQYAQFITNIDGLDIHFIHVRSKYKTAMPLIITHGWPGSVFEMLKIIGPLTDPPSYGGDSSDAFHLVIPSLPGFGFSGKPTTTGWSPDRIARAWAVLMDRLGYDHYVAQGGDWGAGVINAMGRHAPPGLRAIHSNFPATLPPDIGSALASGAKPPSSLSPKEKEVYEALANYGKSGNSAYFTLMSARPQAIGYGTTDSPAGLAAWLLLHPGFSTWNFGNDPFEPLSIDEVLDNITLYWLTNTAASAARIYWENKAGSLVSAAGQRTMEVKVPVAITVFPGDVYKAPESWSRQAYPTLYYFHEVDRGGHFAAWEQPGLFATELRLAFRSFR